MKRYHFIFEGSYWAEAENEEEGMQKIREAIKSEVDKQVTEAMWEDEFLGTEWRARPR